MIRSLFPLLCSILCLMLISGPALAEEKPVILAPPTLMELSGDVVTELKLLIAEIEETGALSKEEQGSLNKLMANPVASKLVIVGDARASALRKNEPVPGFGKIPGAQQLEIDSIIEWGNYSLDQLAAVQESMKGKPDSLSEMGEREALRMQQLMDRMTKAEQTMSNIMKKLSEAQSQIIGNTK